MHALQRLKWKPWYYKTCLINHIKNEERSQKSIIDFRFKWGQK